MLLSGCPSSQTSQACVARAVRRRCSHRLCSARSADSLLRRTCATYESSIALQGFRIAVQHLCRLFPGTKLPLGPNRQRRLKASGLLFTSTAVQRLRSQRVDGCSGPLLKGFFQATNFSNRLEPCRVQCCQPLHAGCRAAGAPPGFSPKHLTRELARAGWLHPAIAPHLPPILAQVFTAIAQGQQPDAEVTQAIIEVFVQPRSALPQRCRKKFRFVFAALGPCVWQLPAPRSPRARRRKASQTKKTSARSEAKWRGQLRCRTTFNRGS